jgi:TonB family protein
MKACHPQGYCVMHVVVGPDGAVRDVRLTHSTGSKVIDESCLDALSPAKFTPALQSRLPGEDLADTAIYWSEILVAIRSGAAILKNHM